MGKTNLTTLIVILVFLPVLTLLTDAKAGCWFPVVPIYSVEEYDDVRCKDMSTIDISDRPNLPATLWFNQETIWPVPAQMPPGCDPDEIMTNAMNPGLGVRSLHQQGITGMGVNVAIIDQPMYLDHPEFSGKIAAYYDTGCGGSESSMHGPAVASLLVGDNCGTAPGANVYYVAAPSWKKDAAYYADALDWIITQNTGLPSPDKIRVVSVSAAPSGPGSPFLYNNQMWDSACARAEANDILVLDCTSHLGIIGSCWYDANDPENVSKCTPGFPGHTPWFDPENILVPSSPRTTAEEVYQGDFSYQYTGRGGLSWSIPYCAGVLAMGCQLHPELTKDKMVEFLFLTAYTKKNGARIINPPEFISFLGENKPIIQLSAEAFEFSATEGGPNPDSQILSICNSGLGTLNWVIDYDCNWLEVDPNTGSSTGETDINNVTLSITNLTLGIDNCELTISDPCSFNSPQTVRITLRFADADGQLHVPSEYGTIQAAIDNCNDGDTVIVADGIYTGAGNRDLDFKGKPIIVRSENGPDNCIIDCQGTETENHRGFYFHSNEGPNSLLRGFAITNSYYSPVGGAIYCYESSPTIDNCMFQGNSGHKGAAIYNWKNASPMLTNCTFSGNSAAGDGGGMYNFSDSSPTLINCVFSENLTIYDGGGIYNVDNANPTLTNCTFSGNSAYDNGGGMYNRGSSPTLNNCTFNKNSASENGGAIWNESYCNPTLKNCTFSGNSAVARGGGIYSRNVQSSLINCIMWDNSAAQGNEIYLAFYSDTRPTIVTVSYSDIEGGYAGAYVETGCTLHWDDGNNLDVDPCFAYLCNGDYHLKSHAGRWYPSIYTAMDPTGDSFIDLSDFAAFANYWQQVGESVPADFDNSGTVDLSDLNLLLDNYLADYPTGEWVNDDVTSPCIDAGDPNSDWTGELWPHGERINMGAYGGTAQASMSLSTVGNKADLDRDGDVDGDDLALLAGMWLVEEVLLSEDINRNGSVNFSDFAELGWQWHWEE